MTFKDKIIIITGASSGIGRACALAFAEAGAHLAISARDMEKLEETASACRAFGAKVIAVHTDVAKEEDCKALIDKTLEAFGRIDVLINNAGMSMRALF